MSALPIETSLPALRATLLSGQSAVIQAPPGAGKTTRVPLALLAEPWLAEGRIVMLEPRRLAARAAAWYMARLRGEAVGETVGYRIRHDTRVGPNTRIEVVTEGVLTRLLLDDPALEGVALVIFDEFHERSVHADLGLAMTLHARALFRSDLRILVMSATLDAAPVAALLGEAPVVVSEGRVHPVETRYLDRPRAGLLDVAVCAAVRQALANEDGDILVFLPGVAEIRRVEELLRAEDLRGIVIAPLYGDLTQEAQDQAIRPSAPDHRKLVLATAIAETSLTIEGVRVVIDSGLMRVPRFSPRTGLSRLDTVPVTRDSADQRRGRAGRLGPGVCYRLWTEGDHAGLVPHRTPEILEADLAPLALDLAAWGVRDPRELAWLDPPPSAAFAQARELLEELGALDATGAITAHGRHMATVPSHPRLAHMLLRANAFGQLSLACDIAALLAERDILRSDGPIDPDVRLRLDVMRRARTQRSWPREAGARGSGRAASGRLRSGAESQPRRAWAEIDRGALRRVLMESDALRARWRDRADRSKDRSANDTDDTPDPGLLLAFAYPDRIAQARPGARGRFVLRSGRGASLESGSGAASEEYIVAAMVDERGAEGRIFLAASLTRADIDAHFGEQVRDENVIEWDTGAGAVRAQRRRMLGALVLDRKPALDADPEAITQMLLDAVAREGLDVLPWTDAARSLQQRLVFLHALDPAVCPDASDVTLLADLSRWLGPQVTGVRSLAELKRLDLERILAATVPARQRDALRTLAPTHLEVPSGSRIAIDYSDPKSPALAVRLQEVFGMLETPRIGGGRVPLTMHLLSPAHRPVQVTRDLASFWRTAYFDVRKDMRGRYPKHHWPEDPLTALPVRGPRRRT